MQQKKNESDKPAQVEDKDKANCSIFDGASKINSPHASTLSKSISSFVGENLMRLSI